MAGDVVVRRAEPGDVAIVEGFIEGALAWMDQVGIPYWSRSEFGTGEVARWVADDLWIAERDGAAVGSFKLQSTDPEIWPEAKPREALYVHRLVVAREHTGSGVGTSMLRAAERVTASLGIPYVRLDCGAPVKRLVRYYTEAGYRFIDERQVGPWLLARFERRVVERRNPWHNSGS